MKNRGPNRMVHSLYEFRLQLGTHNQGVNLHHDRGSREIALTEVSMLESPGRRIKAAEYCIMRQAKLFDGWSRNTYEDLERRGVVGRKLEKLRASSWRAMRAI